MISVKGSVKFLYSVMDRKQFITATLPLWLVDTRASISPAKSYHTSSGWVRKPMGPPVCPLEILCSKIFAMALGWPSDNTASAMFVSLWTMSEGKETLECILTVMNVNQALV